MYYYYKYIKSFQVSSDNITIKEDLSVLEKTNLLHHKACDVSVSPISSDIYPDIEHINNKVYDACKYIKQYLSQKSFAEINIRLFSRNFVPNNILNTNKLYGTVSFEYLVSEQVKASRTFDAQLFNTSNLINLLERELWYDIKYNLNSIEFAYIVNENLPIVFSMYPSSVISHEILGHIFEADNYWYYNYSRLLNYITKFNISIMDDPQFLNCLGLSERDDLFIKSTKTVIFSDGLFTGELIGGSTRDKFCTRSFRRSSFLDPVLPRMSTLIVTGTPDIMAFPKTYILVNHISNSRLHHKEGYVEFSIENSYYLDKGVALFNIKPFKLYEKIENFLARLYLHNTNSCSSYILQCLKKGQVIECGVSSVAWTLGADTF